MSYKVVFIATIKGVTIVIIEIKNYPPYFSIRNPSNDPRTNVIITIETSVNEEFQPIRIAEGSKIRNDMIAPLAEPLSLMSVVAIKKPETTQKGECRKVCIPCKTLGYHK
jgi:hypothetical protein